MQEVLNLGLTLPKDLVKKIDKARGDVPVVASSAGF